MQPRRCHWRRRSIAARLHHRLLAARKMRWAALIRLAGLVPQPSSTPRPLLIPHPRPKPQSLPSGPSTGPTRGSRWRMNVPKCMATLLPWLQGNRAVSWVSMLLLVLQRQHRLETRLPVAVAITNPGLKVMPSELSLLLLLLPVLVVWFFLHCFKWLVLACLLACLPAPSLAPE